jgi:ABC-type nitrate/sulfonate/bicarbonate transport system substrate-binding protein
MLMIRVQARAAAAVAAFAVMAGLAAAAGPAEAQTKIRMGQGLVPVHLAPIVFSSAMLAPKMGKSYTVELIAFRGTPQQMTALASGDLEIAGLSQPAFAAGILTGGLDLVGLADLAQDGPSFSAPFAVRTDSPIKTVADLKGKTVAINARGGSQDLAIRTMLKRAGLDPQADVHYVEVAFNALEAVVRDGKADLASLSAGPWAKNERTGGLRALFHARDVSGTQQFLFYASRRAIVAKHRAAMVDLFEDLIHGVNWLHDPKNRDEALKLVGAATKQPPENFASWVFLKGRDYFHDPKARIDVKALQSNIDEVKAFGQIPSSLDVAKHVDLSLVEEAAARLGKR